MELAVVQATAVQPSTSVPSAQMQVTVPAGLGPGQTMQVTANGQLLQVLIPDTKNAGDTFVIEVPAPVPAVQVQAVEAATSAPVQATAVQGNFAPVQGNFAPVQGNFAPVQGAPVQGAPVQGTFAPVQGSPVQGTPVQGTPVPGAPAPQVIQGTPVPASGYPPGYPGAARTSISASISSPSGSIDVEMLMNYRRTVMWFAAIDGFLTLLSLIFGQLAWILIVFLLGAACGYYGARNLNKCQVMVYLVACIANTIVKLVLAVVVITNNYPFITAVLYLLIAAIEIWITKIVARFYSMVKIITDADMLMLRSASAEHNDTRVVYA